MIHSKQRDRSSPAGILTVILLAALASVAAGDPAETIPSTWKAAAASGPVDQRAVTEIDWHDMSRGDRLQPLTLVRSGKRGRATLVRGAGVILVDPETRLQLPDTRSTDEPARVVQSSGTAIYEVEPRDSGHFEVVTPYLVAGVKGTVFGVTVAERYTLVSVEAGLVRIRSRDGEEVDLRAGDVVRSDGDGRELEVLRGDETDRRRHHDRTADTLRRAHKRHRRLHADRPVRVAGTDPAPGDGTGHAGNDVAVDTTPAADVPVQVDLAGADAVADIVTDVVDAGGRTRQDQQDALDTQDEIQNIREIVAEPVPADRKTGGGN